MAAANGRLTKELTEVGKDDKTSGVKALPVTDGNLRHLKGTIQGPLGTCYEGGVFEIDITIPKQYPFEPPKMKFMTKIWHPNISSQTGAICLVRTAKEHNFSSIIFVLYFPFDFFPVSDEIFLFLLSLYNFFRNQSVIRIF